jgi:hypothetical protein
MATEHVSAAVAGAGPSVGPRDVLCEQIDDRRREVDGAMRVVLGRAAVQLARVELVELPLDAEL